MSDILLSILIPTLVGREKKYDSLVDSLSSQYSGGEIEICTMKDNRELSVGAKRNGLLGLANGKYVCFIDDDDEVSSKYISLVLAAIKTDCDCASLRGDYYVDGEFDGVFEHSLRYRKWKTTNNEVKYERFPNHLNAIRAEIAKQFKFPEKNHGEDFDWSTMLHQSGLLKTEFYIPDIIYYYNYVTNP